ncbi:MAG: CoA pyrophosphatase [Rhodothermales bacterium]
MPVVPFHALIARLRTRLSSPLPGTAAHLTMAPGYRLPDTLRIDDKPCRQAGVLALLFPVGDEAAVLLTQRRHDLKRHAGQLSFPGGRSEPDEPLHRTALRETYEEIGLAPDRIELLGALSPLYINVSNYCVHPYVGATPAEPADLVLQEAEVTLVHTLRLADLLAPGARTMEGLPINGARVDVPVFAVNGLSIWGATAMMLAELLAVCEEAG